MPLSPKSRLGTYEILGPLGAGGMGEVYRAKDLHLGRDVAIKVLPADVAGSPDRLQRLEREARLLASLNHPHIAILHGLEESQEGTRFLVMELVEGKTLAERVARGALSLDEVYTWGSQIADALAAAHERGIVHRDLKPANIMLTKTGVKLIDFGLAKSAATEQSKRDSSDSQTTRVLVTELQSASGGHPLMGTLRHMAPEQLQGKEADLRSDLWAFGTVLHEMVTGKPTFPDLNTTSLTAAILERNPPPVSEGQPLAPTALDHLVSTCLAKDPDSRRRSAADLALDLRWLADGGATAASPGAQAATSKERRRELLLWIAVAALVITSALPWVFDRLTDGTMPTTTDARFELPLTSPTGSADETGLAISPNGNVLAYGDQASMLTPSLVWLRRLGDAEAQALPGTEGAVNLFWSPDGRSLGYVQNGAIKIADLDGGPPRTIVHCSTFGPPSWGSSGIILYAAPDESSGEIRLYKVAATGGVPVVMPVPDGARDGSQFSFPHFLADGDRFLYLDYRSSDESKMLWLSSLDGTILHSFDGIASRVEFAQGQLYYCEQGVLMSRAFEPDSGVLGDESRTVGPLTNANYAGTGIAQFSVAQTGELAYAGGEWSCELRWLDTMGNVLGTLGEPGPFHASRISPSGARVALARVNPESGDEDLWIFDLTRDVAMRIAAGFVDDTRPIWSPNGERLAYSSTAEGPPAVFVRTADASDPPLLVGPTNEKHPTYPTDWSPDGQWIACYAFRENVDLLLLSTAKDSAPVTYAGGPGDQFDGRFSPNGKWIAFASSELGRPEVFISPFSDGDVRHRVSATGGSSPIWSPDGRQLFYLNEGTVWVASFSEDTVAIGVARELFSLGRDATILSMDLAPDGSRFLATVLERSQARAWITVCLRRSVPRKS